METSEIVGLVVAVLSLGGAVWAALVSRRHDREQQTRGLQLPAAQELARTAYAGLAALRYTTPPSRGAVQHRNAILLDDQDARAGALASAREALDAVRSARADVRLVFHPESLAAELSVSIIGHLRACLELAEEFYAEYDAAVRGGSHEEWRTDEGSAKRDLYMRNRQDAYRALDHFAAEVAVRMIRPSWDPRKFDQRTSAPRARRQRRRAATVEASSSTDH